MEHQENKIIKRREPDTFLLWLGIFVSSIIFVSAFYFFLKKENAGENMIFELPKIYWASTLVLFLSNLSLWFANKKLENQDFDIFKKFLAASFFLGLIFMVFQVTAWLDLTKSGTQTNTETTNPFAVYLLSGLHILYTFIGTFMFSLNISKAFQNRTYADTLVFSVNPPNQLNLKLLSTFWYFIGIMWAVIFFFLAYYAS